MAQPKQSKQAKKALHFHAMIIAFLTGLLTFGGLSTLHHDELPNHEVQADEISESEPEPESESKPESEPIENEPDVEPESELIEEGVPEESEQGQPEEVIEPVESDEVDLVVEGADVEIDTEDNSTETEQGIDDEMVETSEVDLAEVEEIEPTESVEGEVEGEDIIEDEVLEVNEIEGVILDSTDAEEGVTTDVEVAEEEAEVTLALPEVVPETAIEKIADPNEESNVLVGKILTQTDVKGEIVEQGTIKLADVDLAGYSDGQPVEIQEAITAMIGLTTTEKDIEKAILESSLEGENVGLIEGILEDDAIEKVLIESADRGLFESLESKIEKAMVDDGFQEELAAGLEDDPDVEIVLESLITQEEKEEIIKNVVNLSLKGDDLSREELLSQAITEADQSEELKSVLTEKLTEDAAAQNTLVEAVAQEQVSVEVKSAKELIRVTASSPDGDIEIPLENLNFKAGSLIMTIDPVREFTPGLHQVEIEINNPISGETERFTQDFTWGVLALNTDQDGYKEGDQIIMHIGVLDDLGKPVCDADIQIEVLTPDGGTEKVMVENTENCLIFDSANIQPDYQGLYTSRQTGEHVINLSATLSNGKTRQTSTSILIQNEQNYCVERQAATRLYPVGESPMTFNLYFPEDFEGYIIDRVPASFGIYDPGQSGQTYSSVGDVNLSEDGKSREITWEVMASAGETHEFSYIYDAPDISPEFYTIGPLELKSANLIEGNEALGLEVLRYTEARQWQIANDEPNIGADSNELLGNWQFNTGSGTTATDETSNGNDGTLTNMESGDWITTTPGSTNGNPYALDFDGSNERVIVTDPAGGELDFGDSDDFTITGWINRDTFTGDDTIVAKRNGIASGDVGYIIYIDDSSDRIIAEVSDGTDEYSFETRAEFTATGWFHFAVAWGQDSAANSKIYVDGEVSEGGSTGTIGDVGDLSNSVGFNVAAESDGGEPFNGKLDDIRIYNKILSSDEIDILANGNQPAGIGNDLELWLRADDDVTTSGSDVTDWLDQSGNGNDFDQGTTANQPDLTSNAVNGHSTITFDGSNDYLDNSSFSEDPLSIFAVIKNTDTGSNERTYFGMESDASGSDDALYMKANDGSGNAVASYLIGGSLVNSSTTNLDNEFYLHAGHQTTTATSEVTLEINGEPATNGTGTGSFANVTDSAVGAGYVSDTLSGYFKGDIAEILVYSVAKTGTDRQKIESYLSLKYGLTLDQSSASGGTNYLDSEGGTIWNADFSDEFEYDITGIGQDDISTLFQTESKSENSDAVVMMNDAGDQGDLEFLIWSNDNGAATWTSTDAPTNYKILNRQWQAQETGDVGTVDVEIDVNDSDFNIPTLQGVGVYHFIYDSDDDGNLSDETPVAMKDDGTAGDETSSDDKWTAQLNFPTSVADGRIDFNIATPVDPPPTVTDGNISINTGSGTSSTFIIGDEIVVTWDNSATGDNNSNLTDISADLSGWGGSLLAPMTDTTACSGTSGDDVYEACYTIVSGSIDNTVMTSVAASNLGGQTATGDSTVATVDNQAPTVTTGNVSVTGANGISGEFIVGDTATGRWDNSATGDNNTDTISSVTFDLSEFRSGDSAISGSDITGIWTADITGALDSQGDSNNNVTVTVTDNAGNVTTLEGTNDYDVDTILPSISSITSVAGDTASTYYDTTDDSSTAIIFTSADTGTGVSACKWDTTDSSYASLGFTCSSTSNCTTNLTGNGAKTVYIKCIDAAGNAMTSSEQVDYTVDSVAPSGTSITPSSTRIIDNTYPSFTVNNGTESGSGIDTSSRVLERSEATYSSNSCGSFGVYSSVTISGTYPSVSDETATGSKCYQYRWAVSDNAGNQTTSSATSTIERVPLTTLIITAGNNQSYGDSSNNPIGHTLTTPLQVQVTDGGTNTAQTGEVTVDFSITSTPTSPTATSQSLSTSSDDTSATGHASTSLTLGDRAGDYQVQASSSDAAVSNTVTFTGTANDHTALIVVESNVSLNLNPVNNASDSFSPTVSVTTNASSYDLQLTPDQWPTFSTYSIINWLSNLGFGWNLNSGTITAYSENTGDPTDTIVYSCSGASCPGVNTIDVDIHAAINFTHPAGIYTNDLDYEVVNISY